MRTYRLIEVALGSRFAIPSLTNWKIGFPPWYLTHVHTQTHTNLRSPRMHNNLATIGLHQPRALTSFFLIGDHLWWPGLYDIVLMKIKCRSDDIVCVRVHTYRTSFGCFLWVTSICNVASSFVGVCVLHPCKCCMFIHRCFSLCLFLCLTVSVSFSLFLCLSLCVFLSFSVSVSVRLSVCLFLSLSAMGRNLSKCPCFMIKMFVHMSNGGRLWNSWRAHFTSRSVCSLAMRYEGERERMRDWGDKEGESERQKQRETET